MAIRPTTPGRDSDVRRFLVMVMAAGFAALIVAVALAFWTTREAARHTAAVTHSYEVELALGNARRFIEQSETARRGLILSPGNARFVASYREADAGTGAAFEALGRLTADNQEQQRSLRRVGEELAVLRRQRAETTTLTNTGRVDAAVTLFRRQVEALPLFRIRVQFDAVAAQERRVLLGRDAALRRSVGIFYAVAGIAAALVLVLAVVTLLVLLGYTRALNVSHETLRRLNATLEDQVATRTADLTRANAEIQRFAYIVSHDLRSPLVNVMGFTAELEAAVAPIQALLARVDAEAPSLADEDARIAANEDLPEAIGFIRTSTQKMDRLINAILRLSREGRRTLSPEPVDVAAVLAAIEGSMRHLLDDRGVTLTIEAALPGLVTDRLALEQVLSNLVENASKYRHPGRPGEIAITGREEGGRVLLSVADNGRGIAPADHDRVFDLFRRSGAQDQPGEGIGLAHVRALVYRLGGTIALASTLGEGATFTLNLPRELTPGERSA